MHMHPSFSRINASHKFIGNMRKPWCFAYSRNVFQEWKAHCNFGLHKYIEICATSHNIPHYHWDSLGVPTKSPEFLRMMFQSQMATSSQLVSFKGKQTHPHTKKIFIYIYMCVYIYIYKKLLTTRSGHTMHHNAHELFSQLLSLSVSQGFLALKESCTILHT